MLAKFPFALRVLSSSQAFGADLPVGVSVTPGATNAEGSWTQIGTAVAAGGACLIVLNVSGGATAAQIKNHLLDIGIDPAGGSSYGAVISNIICGNSAAQAAGRFGQGFTFMFPLMIPAGATIAARIQGSNGTAGTVRVFIWTYGSAGNGIECIKAGTFSETIGTITNSAGVTFTPGNAAQGAWALLGTTSKDLWWWQVGVQLNDTTSQDEACTYELAYGDGTNMTSIVSRVYGALNASEEISQALHFGYCPVPAGSSIYIRGACSEAPSSTYNGVAIGIGGDGI